MYQISNMNPCGEIRLPSAKGKNPFRMTCVLILTEHERMLREYEKNLAMAFRAAAKIANSMREMVAWYSNKVHVV